jgi:hypothetical protein
VLRLVCKRLRDWSKKEPPRSSRDLTPLAAWLEQTCAPEGAEARRRCRRFAHVLTYRLNCYRRAEWISFLAAHTDPWVGWDQESAERPVLRAQPEALHGGLLRDPQPLTAEDVLDLPARLAQQPEGKDGIKWFAESISFAVDDLLEQVDRQTIPLVAASQQSLQERCRNDALPDAFFHLEELPSWGWRAGLKQLLCSSEGTWGWGCLTPNTWRRFYYAYPEFAEPFLSREEFQQADAIITDLHNWADGHEAMQTADKTLQWLLRHFDTLGRLAAKMKRVLAGSAAGPHRLWIGYLLDNFIRLGELAGYTREEKPPAREAPPAPEDPPAVAATLEEAEVSTDLPTAADDAVEEPPADAEPPASPAADAPPPPADEDIADKAAAAAPATVQPPVSDTEAARDDPLAADARFAELLRKHRSVKVFDDVVSLARKMRDACGPDWPEGTDALESLRARHRQFRDRLVRASTAPASEADGYVRSILRTLMEELIANLVRLDQVLPGEGEDGRLPPRGPAALSAQVQAVRDRLFEFMARHGGYSRYPIEIGDSTTKHRGLRVQGLVPSRRVEQNCIARIVLPGYVRVRDDGKQEVVRPPEVCLAK